MQAYCGYLRMQNLIKHKRYQHKTIWKVSMVRNFYIQGNIDGRKTKLSGGSSSKDGGMILNLTQRNNGCIEKCASIECVADGDELKTIIYDKDGKAIFENVTKR